MKTLIFLVTLLAGFTIPAAAAGGIAAKDAVRTLARERGASWLERIVQLSGDRGMDQPGAWHIVATDGRGGLREFFVSSKGILSEGPLPAASVAGVQGPAIAQKKFTVDSTIAFMRAEAAAKKARIGFDSATYRLRSPGGSAAPVWQLQLNNAAGQKLADVTLSAASGKIIQMLAYNPQPPAPPPSGAQQAMEQTREVVNRGAASVGRGLNRAGGWIRRKVAPEPAPPPYYVPPSQ